MSDKNKVSTEYRKNKKINKSKIRDEQSKKNRFLNHDDSYINELPSGMFEKKKPLNENTIENNNENVIKPIKEEPLKTENIEECDEYEQFTDDYFEQKTI